MSWRRIICSLFGHEHTFQASIIRKDKRYGLTCFRSIWIERCYRCGNEQRLEFPTDITLGEIASLFTLRHASDSSAGRLFDVLLDGRPMGWIVNHGHSWSAWRSSEELIIKEASKERATASLW